MSEIWNEEAIGKVCNKVSLMGIPPFYVTAPDKMEGFSWIIAPYRDLRVIAPLLRTFEDHASPAESGEIRRHDNDELRNILDELGVRFGQRRTDVPPHGDRVTRIGERMTPSEIIALKTLELESRWAGERSSGGGQPFEARVRELHPEVERFWVSRTLEAEKRCSKFPSIPRTQAESLA